MRRRPFGDGAQPLSLLNQTSGGGINIASWHSRHSLTWSWILSARPYRGDEKRWRLWFWTHKTNDGRQWGMLLPFVAIQWHRQRPMWFCDMRSGDRERAWEAEKDAFERGRRQGRRDVFQGVGHDQRN